MSIKIIPAPDIYLTESEYRRYIQEYKNYSAYHVSPSSFEDFVINRRKYENEKSKS